MIALVLVLRQAMRIPKASACSLKIMVTLCHYVTLLENSLWPWGLPIRSFRKRYKQHR